MSFNDDGGRDAEIWGKWGESYCNDLRNNPPAPPAPKRKPSRWRHLRRMLDELVFCVIVGAAGYGFYRLTAWGNSLPVSTGHAVFVPTTLEMSILVGMPCSLMIVLTAVCLGIIARRDR